MSLAAEVWQRPCGALPFGDCVEFRVWAPLASGVAVRIRDREHELAPVDDGVWTSEVFADPGDDYLFAIDG